MMELFIISFFALLGLAALLPVLIHWMLGGFRPGGPRQKKHKGFAKNDHPLTFGRAHENPLLSQKNGWEGEAVFNPGAVEDNGRVHLFYRAVGTDGVSRVGYASSEDGVHFDERLPFPVFSLEEAAGSAARRFRLRRHAGLVASGGSWAGCEDPRAVIMDGRLYLSFSSFAGWDSVRMGISSISLEDFRARRFNWSEPVFLSAPGEVHKNWVLFPEKINGKYAILHSIHGATRDEVLVDYVDSIDKQPTRYIRSSRGGSKKRGAWDYSLRSAGPPPLKTPSGWLTFYHANDEREPHKYKLGALLLDLANPTKVIARSSRPVLEPEALYEENGAKPGIVYACGSLIRDGLLTIYYGASDNYVCAAAAPLTEFMKKLTDTRTPVLVPLPA